MESPGVQTATFKGKLDNYLCFQRKDIFFTGSPELIKNDILCTKNTRS